MSTPTISLPAGLVPDDHRICAFQVVGDSMTPGIRDGDYIVVDLDQEAHDGDIAAVHVTNWRGHSGRVVKYLSHGGTVLKSSNPKYPPMVLCPEHRPRVLGVVVGVVRSWSQAGPRDAASRRPGVRGAPDETLRHPVPPSN